MLERIIASAYMNQNNAFDEDDHDYDRGDDGDGNLDGDVNMDSGENLIVEMWVVMMSIWIMMLKIWVQMVEIDGGGADSGNLDDDGENLVSEGENSDEGSSDPEIVDFVPPPVTSNSNHPGCSGSKDYKGSMDDSCADTAFATLIENLSPQSRNLGRVMHFVRDVCENLDWVLLKILSETMQEFVLLDQQHTKPSVCRVNVADIEINFVV